MILFAEDTASETASGRPFMLADLPEDIRPEVPRAEFGIGRPDDTGTGYTFIAVLTLTMEQLSNWDKALAPKRNAGAFRFFMSPDNV